MAWWDANSPRSSRNGSSPLRLSKSRKDLAFGDAFPKLDFTSILPANNMATPVDSGLSSAMDHDRIILSPISEEHFSPPPISPLTVHVTIQFTDPVIRSRYSQSYTSSHTFEPTNRICNGLLRRIQLCSEELLTRKDSTALDQYKDETHERKAMRFEITFRIVRRGYGEWAERTFRSYQKQPLTVGLTKDIQLATHRIVGLFLRRYDKNFQWLDGPIVDHSPEAPETALPSSDARLSLLCVPRSRFIEATQSFEFVPGYTIQLSFRSRNPRRALPVFKRTIKVESTQPAPLSLLMSEEIQWKGLEAINRGLEDKKRELYKHMGVCQATDCPHSDDDALQIELSISNNLGTLHHVHREIKCHFSLFRDPEAKDCEDFLRSIQNSLVEARDNTDSQIDKIDDFEFNVVEIRGRTWSVRSPVRFSQGPSASYGRRTIQAALDRIQTGIGDVLRGNHVAVHITARKRGHLILDKAIISREKRGRPTEIFSSAEEQRTAFVTRLKMRIERDIDMVFRDTCSIDDIGDDEEDVIQHLSLGPEAGYLQARSGSIRSASPASPANSTRRSIHSNIDSLPGSPTKRPPQRSFSLGHRSVSSAASVVSAKNLDDFRSVDMISESSSRRSSLSMQESPLGDRLLGEASASIPPSPTKPQRRFSLMPRTSSSSTRVSSASTLICETPSLLEESAEVEISRVKSTEGEIAKAVLLDLDKVPETDGTPSSRQASSMTLDEVANIDTTDAAGMVPVQVLESLGRDLSSSPLSDAEVMAEKVDQSSLKPEEEKDTTQRQCGSVDERLIPAGESEATDEAGNTQKTTTMDAFQDAQEYSTAGLALHAASLSAKDGLTSPGVDEYSTAPSTPALSLGAESSPRHSLLATPSSYLRRGEGEELLFSGAKGEEGEKGNRLGAGFEPESPETESGTETTDLTETVTDASDHLQSDSNESEDHLSLGDSIESATEQSPPAPGVEMGQGGIEASGIDSKRNVPDESGPDNQPSPSQVESPLSDTAPEVADGGEILPDEPVPSDTKPPAELTADETNAPDTNAANNQETQVDQHIYHETQNFGAEGVRSGSDLADLADPDFPTQNVRSDPAPVSRPGEGISGANLGSNNAEDGTEEEKSPDVVVGVDSDANPFVVLDNEAEAPGDVPEESSESDDLEPSYAEVASKVKDKVPETTLGISASEALPDSRKDQFPEEPFVDPTGSAVDAIEAEVAEAVGIDEHSHTTDETDKPEPQRDETEAPEKPTSDRAVQLSPEAESDAAEADEDGRLHSNINADGHSILKHSPAPAHDGETPGPASAAVDPDTYPDDIGAAEVAQLQARLGEDYELGESNSGLLDENESNGRDFPGVTVGVLDQNIGTDPDSAVVFSDSAGDDLQHQQQERVSSRRASEVEEDICGHEYLTGSNRVGYAAVCLAGSEPEGVDEVGPDAPAVPEALAEGDRHDKDVSISTHDQNFSGTDGEAPVATEAILSSQVDEAPPVVVEVIKHILTGDSPQASEPEQTAPPEVDDQTTATSEKDVPPEEAGVSTGVLHTEDTESTPAIVTVITGDNEVPESEVSLVVETKDGLPEITENPPDVVVDLIKQVFTGEFDSGDQKNIDLANQLHGDEHVAGQIDEEGPVAVPETLEPVPVVVIIADENEKQVPESDEANNFPTEITEAPAAVITVLEQSGPEITPSTEAKTDDLSGSLPTLIRVAVPDISKHVRHIATEPSPSGAGEPQPENISVSVMDFESTGPSVPKPRSFAYESGPEPTGLWVDEEAETPRATRDDVDGGINIKTPFFFAPVAPISVQSGDSSSSSAVPIPASEWDTVGISSRGSVDTIRHSFEEYESELDEPQNQPQTAGYLGLGDAHRKIKVGLGVLGKGGRDGDATRRPRGDIRRYSLPLQYLLDGEQDQNGAALGGKGKGKGKSSPRTTWSKLMGAEVEGEEDQNLEHEHAHHHKHHKKRAEEDGKEHGHHHHQHEKKEESSFLGEEHSAEQAIYDRPTVVPRMMMLLAGVVAVGKIIKGPSGHY